MNNMCKANYIEERTQKYQTCWEVFFLASSFYSLFSFFFFTLFLFPTLQFAICTSICLVNTTQHYKQIEGSLFCLYQLKIGGNVPTKQDHAVDGSDNPLNDCKFLRNWLHSRQRNTNPKKKKKGKLDRQSHSFQNAWDSHCFAQTGSLEAWAHSLLCLLMLTVFLF